MTSYKQEQRERSDLLGSTQSLTYHGRARSEITLQDQGGRYAVETTIVGSKPGPVYPRLPDQSPFLQDTGVEPPLGYRIDDLEPCGNPHEIERSLGGGPTTPLSQMLSTGSRGETDKGGPADPSPPFKLRRL